MQQLSTTFVVRHAGAFGARKPFVAVDDVSLQLRRGQTFGLLGESGCGKTTLGRTILRLTPASGGRVLFDGRDVLALTGRRMRVFRRRAQLVFQDPQGSLDPRMRIEQIVDEPLVVHRFAAKAERRRRVADLLRRVHLDATIASRYPHELSGGQRQRVGIARAIALEPELVVLDEPVSALDVSVQGQIINLLMELQSLMGVSYVMISHDPAVMRHVSHVVGVMYAGRLVERGPADEIFERARHPYTQQLLLAAHPPRVSDGEPRVPAVGAEPARPGTAADSCAYHASCPLAVEECLRRRPTLRPIGEAADHAVACHRADEITPTTIADMAGRRTG